VARHDGPLEGSKMEDVVEKSPEETVPGGARTAG
jgi:hypothetical protein